MDEKFKESINAWIKLHNAIGLVAPSGYRINISKFDKWHQRLLNYIKSLFNGT